MAFDKEAFKLLKQAAPPYVPEAPYKPLPQHLPEQPQAIDPATGLSRGLTKLLADESSKAMYNNAWNEYDKDPRFEEQRLALIEKTQAAAPPTIDDHVKAIRQKHRLSWRDSIADNPSAFKEYEQIVKPLISQQDISWLEGPADRFITQNLAEERYRDQYGDYPPGTEMRQHYEDMYKNNMIRPLENGYYNARYDARGIDRVIQDKMRVPWDNRKAYSGLGRLANLPNKVISNYLAPSAPTANPAIPAQLGQAAASNAFTSAPMSDRRFSQPQLNAAKAAPPAAPAPKPITTPKPTPAVAPTPNLSRFGAGGRGF